MGISEVIEIKGEKFPDGFMVWWKKVQKANRYFVHVKLNGNDILTKEIDRNISYFVLAPLPELKFDVYVEAENSDGDIFSKSVEISIQVSQFRRTSVGYTKNEVTFGR